jgi:hypothetical protein
MIGSSLLTGRLRLRWSLGCGLLLERGGGVVGGVIAEAVLEQREGALAEPADVGGEQGG